MGKQVSKATAQSGDTLTYSIGVTVIGANPSGMVLTDTLPAYVGFVDFGSVGSGSATFVSNTSLISWTLASPLSPGIYDLTYQTKVNPFALGGTNIVNGAQLTYTGLVTPLTASVTVQVIGPYTVKAGVYNEAGELIKQLFIVRLSQRVDEITLQSNVITSLAGANNTIALSTGGYHLGSWNGSDLAGNPVSNGIYHIKVDSVDDFGVVTSVTRQATVSRSLAKISINIYNEAGEVVRHLYAQVDDPNGAEMTDVILSSQVVQPGVATTQGTPVKVQIMIQASGSPVTLSWDGTSDAGAIVTAGHYLLEAHWYDGQGGTTDISRGLLVMAGGNKGKGILTVRPNVLTMASGKTSANFRNSSSLNLTLKVKLYTVAGELVTKLQGDTGTNQAIWDASGIASGVYLAVVETENVNGGVIGSQILKILVMH